MLGLAVAVAPPVALRDDAEGYETGCSESTIVAQLFLLLEIYASREVREENLAIQKKDR